MGGPRVFQWCSDTLDVSSSSWCACSLDLELAPSAGTSRRWWWEHVPKKLTCGRTVASEAMGQETAEDQEEEQGKERKVMVATRMEKTRVPLRQRSIATVGWWWWEDEGGRYSHKAETCWSTNHRDHRGRSRRKRPSKASK